MVRAGHVLDLLAEGARSVLVEIQHDHVRLQAFGLDDDPLRLALQSDHVDAVLLEHRTEADRHDRRQVPEHDPKCGGLIHVVKPPEPPSRGDRADRAACDAHSVTSCAWRDPSRRRVLQTPITRSAGAPGTSIVASVSSPSAVRAITRCEPGRMRSNR